MARKLRAGSGTHGLILANGGVLTYQHVICLSSKPRADNLPYPAHNPLPSILEHNSTPAVDETAEGEAIIEVSYSYNVDIALFSLLIISRHIRWTLIARTSLY